MGDLNCSFVHDFSSVRNTGCYCSGCYRRFCLCFEVHPGNTIELLDLKVVLVLGGNLLQLSVLKFFTFFSFNFQLLNLLEFFVEVTDLLFQTLDEEILLAFR